ncbi:MAG: hypothetical protein FD152_4307, partial [Xanthobacteraceae bacterium]
MATTPPPKAKLSKVGTKGGLDEASIAAFHDHEIVTPKRNL